LAKNEENSKLEAIKVVDKTSLHCVASVRSLGREIHTLRRVKHENIVACFGALHGPDYIIVRMEVAGHENLYRTMKASNQPLGMAVSQKFQAQICSALAHLHDLSIAHRDVKPENITVDLRASKIKIVDFGSIASTQKQATDMAGTMPFMAPEVLAAGDSEPYDAGGCDVWAAATVLLEMLCGIGKMNKMLDWGRQHVPCPTRALELRDFFRHPLALADALAADLGEDAPLGGPLQELVAGMLQFELARRWSAEQVCRSPWLQQPP